MDTHFERFFGDAAVRKVWFMQTIQLAMAAGLTNAYEDFGVQADMGLEMTAGHYKVSMLGEEKNLILSTLRPYPEVAHRFQASIAWFGHRKWQPWAAPCGCPLPLCTLVDILLF